MRVSRDPRKPECRHFIQTHVVSGKFQQGSRTDGKRRTNDGYVRGKKPGAQLQSIRGDTPFSERKPVCLSCLFLRLVMPKNFPDLLHGESVQFHDLGFGSIHGRQKSPGLLPAVHIDDHPSFMLPVHAPPLRIRQVMQSGPQEKLNGKSTRLFIRLMGNFHKKSCHRMKPPLRVNAKRKTIARAMASRMEHAFCSGS